MTDNKKNNDGINPVVAAITGAAVGAGVAIAGAAVLRDEENRKKVTDTMHALKDKGMEYVDGMQNEAAIS